MRKVALVMPIKSENYRCDFSSERTPHINKPATDYNNKRKKERNWSRVPDGCLIPRQTD
jgi:hypothetical protein